VAAVGRAPPAKGVDVTSGVGKILARLHPSAIRSMLRERRELRSAIVNANWLVVGRLVYLFIGMVVGIWVTRYLGPERYGVLNYCIAFAALFSVLSSLGLNFIVVRNLVQDPAHERETLGNAAIIKLVGAVVQIAVTTGAILVIRGDEPDYILFVVIAAAGYLFSTFEVIDYWFQSRVAAKHVVLSNLFSTATISLFKIVLVLLVAPLTPFVWAIPAATFLYCVGLVISHRRVSGSWFTSWRIRASSMKSLLADAWPLSLSALATVIYMKIDLVMIGEMLNEAAVGQYSVAVRLSEMWYFLPMFVSGSIFPAMLKLREKDRGLYYARLQTFFDGFFWFSAVVALGVTFVARFVVVLLYGPEFAEAGAVLAVHIWSGVFVFMGVASSRHLVAENLTKISFYRTIAGTISNVALNLVFIPRFGIMGAAWATLISYAISGWAANAAFGETRRIFVMQLNSVNPVSLKRYLVG
jgi:PST family polysaccharide transporter